MGRTFCDVLDLALVAEALREAPLAGAGRVRGVHDGGWAGDGAGGCGAQSIAGSASSASAAAAEEETWEKAARARETQFDCESLPTGYVL